MDLSRMEQACLDRAKDSALHALSDLGWPVADRLREYYDPDGDFAGASFTQLGPVVPDDITAADLYAVRLLNVRVGRRATRQLLDDGSTRRRILTALRALPTTDLADAGPDTWAAMGELYEAVKAGPSAKHARTPNPWVTASKLCARKRPDLFPVRDRGRLRLPRADPPPERPPGLAGLPVPDHTDRQVGDAIDAATDEARGQLHGSSVTLDKCRLRLLDVALWTHARKLGGDQRRSPPARLTIEGLRS
jgi:hypothetical protein